MAETAPPPSSSSAAAAAAEAEAASDPALASAPQAAPPASQSPLPRVTIQFCTQCKWMLRAAYFAQELLSTFSTALGEVGLQPSTGGRFVVDIYWHAPATSTSASSPSEQAAAAAAGGGPVTIRHRTLWDRSVDGGFPETKELKRRVRDIIEPDRDLGHVDRTHPAGAPSARAPAVDVPGPQSAWSTAVGLGASATAASSAPGAIDQPQQQQQEHREDRPLPRTPAATGLPGADSRSWKRTVLPPRRTAAEASTGPPIEPSSETAARRWLGMRERGMGVRTVARRAA